MTYFARNPLGYKNLLTWKQADEIYIRTDAIVKTFHPIRDSRLIEQMVSSARSGKRNIEEGFKRATTHEYITFLGYSLGSLAELRGDYEDCLRQGKIGQTTFSEMERLLRGEDVMLGRQIRALEQKMDEFGTRPTKERGQRFWQNWHRHDTEYMKLLEQFGMKRLENGQVVKKAEGISRVDKG